MNLKPLRAIIPGKMMLLVAALLGLGIGWYLFKASVTGDYLVQRNFNHLNQIGNNINANLDTLRKQVQFNLRHACDEGEQVSATQIEECVAAIENRLVGMSPFIADGDAINTDVVRFLPDDDNGGDSCKDLQREIDRHKQDKSVQLMRGKLRSRFPIAQVNAGGDSNATPPRNADARRGGGQAPAAQQTYRALKGSYNFVTEIQQKQDDCENGLLLTHLQIDLHFDRVRGLALKEGYFDSIIIARSVARSDAGVRDRSEDTSQAIPEILYNSAARDRAAPEGDIRQLFQLRNAFERMNSLFDIEYEQAARRERSSGFAELAEKAGDKKAVKVRPLTQSAVVPIDVGGFSHLAFVQPLYIDNLLEDSGDLVIVGIVDSSAFNTLKYAMPFNYLSMLLLLLVVGLLSFNFIRLALVRKKGVLFRSDTYLSYGSLMGVAALVTILLANVTATMALESMYANDKALITDRVVERFDVELADKLRLLRLVNIVEDTLEEGGNVVVRPFCGYSVVAKEVARTKDEPPGPPRRKIQCATRDMPVASSLFQLDDSGKQTGNYYAFNTNTPGVGFTLTGRGYYRHIVDNTAWQYGTSGAFFDELNGQRFYMERIESLADTALETAVSIPATEFDGTPADHANVTAIAAKFRSLEDMVLPPGFGLAVFENHSGRVLYHSDVRRSLRENFYHATGDDAALKGVVVSRAEASLGLNYKGEAISATVTPMPHVPWTLAVYYRKSLVDIVNFHFSMTAAILGAIYIFGFMFLSALVSYIKNLMERPGLTEDNRYRRIELIPRWTYPIDGAETAYARLTLAYLGLVLLYLGVIYYIDIFHSIVWLLGVPPILFWSWHRAVCPRFHEHLRLKWPPLAWAMPVVAVALCAVYAGIVLWQGGLGYLLLVALVLVVTWRFWYQRAAARLKDARDQDEPATLLAQGVLHYRRATTLFVLLLAVLPALLLHNENYDVHERLWVEFANWSNVDRLKARSQAYRQYSQRMYPIDGNAPGQGGPAADKTVALADFLVKNWEGVYLPRTEIDVLAEDLASARCQENTVTAVPTRDGQKRWPAEIELPPGGTNAMLPELMTSMLVVRGARLDLGECHPHMEYGDDASAGQHYHPDALLEVSFLKNLVKSLPILSSTGSLLEGFSDRENTIHEHKSGVMPGSSAGPRRGGPQLIVMDEVDPQTGIYYLTSAMFPHTRSAASHLVFLPYIFYISASALLVYILTGFLMRRQMGVRFAAKQISLDAPLEARHLESGCAVVVPATRELHEGYREITSLLDTELLPHIPPYDGGLESDKDENLFVVRDLRRVLLDRELSATVLDRLEWARGREREDSEAFRLVVLSTIDPHYWLKHRHVGRDMSPEEFHRWEALLRPLPIHALGRGQVSLNAARYREVWESSCEDERMLLVGLHYEGILNYRNRASTISLYRRGLVRFHNLQFFFDDKDWENFVAHQMSREEFKRAASRYENELWMAVRGPLLIALLVAVFFIAYVAQDEMRVVFSLLGTVGGAFATVSALSDRFRDFRGYLGG